MKNKFDTKQLFAKFLKKRGQRRDPQLMHPEREWTVGLVVAVLLFSAAAFMSAYTYFKNQSISIDVATDTTADVVYRESIVKEVLATMEEREILVQSLDRGEEQRVVEEVTTELASSTVEITTETATTTEE